MKLYVKTLICFCISLFLPALSVNASGIFIDSESSATNATEYTFSSASLGTESSDRTIVLIFSGDSQSGDSESLSSLTVGGENATIIHQFNSTGVGNTRDSLGIAYIELPNGTTGDIVLTWSNTMRNAGVGWWNLTELASSTPYALTAENDRSVNLNIPENAFVIGGLHDDEMSANVTWTGLTEDFDVIVEFGSTGMSGASDIISEQTGYTVSYSASGGGGTRPLLLASSWQFGSSTPQTETATSTEGIQFETYATILFVSAAVLMLYIIISTIRWIMY